jgi:hypothetical protein
MVFRQIFFLSFLCKNTFFICMRLDNPRFSSNFAQHPTWRQRFCDCEEE